MSYLINIKDSRSTENDNKNAPDNIVLSCLQNRVTQYILACFYNNKKDLEKAFYWYKKAADKGHINAQYVLASLYKNGEGTEKNLKKAFKWYLKAAESGNYDAIEDLATCYHNGEGTKKNSTKALRWEQKLAERAKQ